jgi:hypothetical protein
VSREEARLGGGHGGQRLRGRVRKKQQPFIRQASVQGRQCFAAKAAPTIYAVVWREPRPARPWQGGTGRTGGHRRCGRPARGRVACGRGDSETPRCVCACVGKRGALGGAGGPDGEVGAARARRARGVGWPKLCHCIPV